jgi:hypothetical protein
MQPHDGTHTGTHTGVTLQQYVVTVYGTKLQVVCGTMRVQVSGT